MLPADKKDNPFDIYESHVDLSAHTQEISTRRGKKTFTIIMVILVIIMLCLLAGICIYSVFILPERREARQQELIEINASNTLTSAAATLAEEIRLEIMRLTASPMPPQIFETLASPTLTVQP